jgi:dynein heavy chain
MKVLKDMDLCELADGDEPFFNAGLPDVFIGITIDLHAQEGLRNAIIRNGRSAALGASPGWLPKVTHPSEPCEVRRGPVVLGPSGTGRTAVVQTFVKGLAEDRGRHPSMAMNPKAIPSSQMFGTVDRSSNDWTGGLFSSLRRLACTRTNERVWIGLDGPVDAIWIENLDSVLGNDRNLASADGARLPMPATVKLSFPLGSLGHASPATISAAGVISVPSPVRARCRFAMRWAKKVISPQSMETLTVS